MDDFKLEELRHQFNEKVNIVDFLNEFISPVSRMKDGYSYCCPLHGEKTPSFFAYPERNEFVCYGCRVRGKPADFIFEVKKQEAIMILEKYLEKSQQQKLDNSCIPKDKDELPIF